MITDEQLKEWREITDGATAGPLHPMGGAGDFWAIYKIMTANGGILAETTSHGNSHNDAKFFCEARTAMPLLIEEVDFLRRANSEKTKALLDFKEAFETSGDFPKSAKLIGDLLKIWER